MAALRMQNFYHVTVDRMVNRRRLLREMLSDNGGNFVGGNKELSDMVKELTNRRK